MRRLSILLFLPLIGMVAACGSDDSGGSVKAPAAVGGGGFCKKASLVDSQFKDLGKAFAASGIPSGAVFSKAASALDRLAADAPSEIRTDFKTVAGGVRKIASVLGDIDLSNPAALSDPANAEKLQQMNTDLTALGKEVGSSSDRIATYLKKRCGIDIEASTTTTAG